MIKYKTIDVLLFLTKHIILDTASLVSLFCPANKTDGIKKGELHKNLKENQHDIWNAFLNLNHKIFRNQHYQFHHQIQTFLKKHLLYHQHE